VPVDGPKERPFLVAGDARGLQVRIDVSFGVVMGRHVTALAFLGAQDGLRKYYERLPPTPFARPVA
jgi:hypothetical protein